MILRTIKQSLLALLMLLLPEIATAQTPSAPTPAASDQVLKPEQLEALVSPIALYPDSLLSNCSDGLDLSAGDRAGRALAEP
jgi:hypothetical protein